LLKANEDNIKIWRVPCMRGILVGSGGVIRNVKVGFSWTTLFFGVLVPLFRGDFKWFIIMLLCDFTIVAWFIFPFIYNRIYIKDLIEKGYKPHERDLAARIREAGITI
jgi:hypothetical protein